MATRIYQGRIISANFESPQNSAQAGTALDSLVYTFNQFHDATNYHLVAIAGMISPAIDPKSTLGKFRSQIKSIWHRHPRDKEHAQTLQQSVTKTLNIPANASFEDAVDAIYAETPRRDLLPYVLQIIIENTAKGDGAIQQGGRSLLPKLCDIHFGGNFDYSIKERNAAAGKIRLQNTLHQATISQEELETIANDMDLSWAGIKTQPNEDLTDSLKFDAAETQDKITAGMEELCEILKKHEDSVWKKYEDIEKIDLHAEVSKIIRDTPLIIGDKLLSKNNKTAPSLKLAAIFFMYYPCRISAELLKMKIGTAKKTTENSSQLDVAALENDPIFLCRGVKKYIYKGFTALPEWEATNNEMYSTEWDILAFKEALKTLHSFEKKTEERNKHVEKLQAILNYQETGIGNISNSEGEEETQLPVLGGDPRFELLQELVQEIAPENYADYTISSRALNGYEEIRERWQKAQKQPQCTEVTLIDIVRKSQSELTRFGSGVLFEKLCEKKYQPIWNDWVDTDKKAKPRSQNILRDFNNYQALKKEIIQYSEPINITAAEPNASPRQLLFSDLKNFGPKSKGHEYIKGKNAQIRLRGIIRNSKGHLETTNIIVQYSAPRFERDELGTDATYWVDNKNEAELTSWLQPMMKALNLNPAELHMSKEPALGLVVKRHPDSTKQKNEASCFLNFPVSIDFSSIHQQIGKAAIWDKQLLGKDEHLHLHWPSTQAKSDTNWWDSPRLRENGFEVMGIDLGVRYAAAWSLIHVGTAPMLQTPSGNSIQGRSIGNTQDTNWYGFATKNGIIRIDGEGKCIHRENDQVQAPDGISEPTPEDVELAEYLFKLAHFSVAPRRNILMLCDDASRAFRKLLSRCRRFQSLLIKLKNEEEQEKAIKEAIDYFSWNETTAQFIPGLLECLKNKDTAQATALLLTALINLRNELPSAAEKLTNLLLPRKHGDWVWHPETREGYICAGRMLISNKQNTKRRIFHRGGLSVARLNQIETLRQLIQSMNRILHETPGVKADFGFRLRDVRVVDPCPDILRKIENIREQRVNKIAHEITAQALGLKLLPPRKGKNASSKNIIHGEYTTIPNRKPVDFVILENLSRYRTSIDRTPAENSTLMMWAHRQIAAKVRQLLEEVFGIPVLFAHAAYTSKFDSLTSAPGFRAVEMTERLLDKLADSNNEEHTKLAGIYKELLKQHIDKRDGMKLLMPHEGNNGEFFICKTNQGVRMRNADINAATNIAWRGIAAPEALNLLHRVRAQRKKDTIQPVYSSQREKALQNTWVFTPTQSLRAENSYATLFCIRKQLGLTAEAYYGPEDTDSTNLLIHGKTLWSFIKSQRWNYCHEFNIRVLRKIGADTSKLERLLNKQQLLAEDDSDIPLS